MLAVLHCDRGPSACVHCMQERDIDAANSALLIYLACTRKLLRLFNGYECQEADGSFMLAFKAPIDSLLFCLMVCCSLPL